jgi:hypothetical protein
MVKEIFLARIPHPLCISPDPEITCFVLITQRKISHRHSSCQRKFDGIEQGILFIGQLHIYGSAQFGQLMAAAYSDIGFKPDCIANRVVRLVHVQVYFFLWIVLIPALKCSYKSFYRLFYPRCKGQHCQD